jgi:hypothetical protein
MDISKNQIDYVMISKKHMSYISNMRSYRSADADINHYSNYSCQNCYRENRR